jgi:hypothetical protein
MVRAVSRSIVDAMAQPILTRVCVIAVFLALLAAASGCAPGLQADGSVAVRAVRAGDGWLVEVPQRYVGRALVMQRPLARSVHVPRGFVPPPGTCRLWRPQVSPALQEPFGPCPPGEPTVPAGAYLIRG